MPIEWNLKYYKMSSVIKLPAPKFLHKVSNFMFFPHKRSFCWSPQSRIVLKESAEVSCQAHSKSIQSRMGEGAFLKVSFGLWKLTDYNFKYETKNITSFCVFIIKLKHFCDTANILADQMLLMAWFGLKFVILFC